MTGPARSVAALFSMIALVLAGQSRAQGEDSTCVTCHEVDIDEALALPVPEWRESIHAEHQVSCDACHGGDPRLEDGDASMSEEAGFQDLPSWAEMTDHCGMCHEQIAERYRHGRFGRALEAGSRVATCATCHMQDGHRIAAARPQEIVVRDECSGCPELAEPETALRLLREVAGVEAALAGNIEAVESKGIELSDYRADFHQVREAFVRALHEFDDEGLGAARALAVTQYDGIGEQVAVLDREADGRMRLGLGLLVALALLFAALWMTQRNLDGR